MNKPLISILMPMYNVEKYLEKSLEALMNQTYKNIEIVLVDDGSTDNTFKIASKLAKRCEKIVLYQKENQKNVSLTRNYLLEHINGEYFTFVDADDNVSKTFVEDLYDILTRFDADLSCCNFYMGKVSPIFSKRKIKNCKVFDSKDDIMGSMYGSKVHFMLWNKLYKKSLLNDIKFDENLKYGEDFAFCHDYLKNSKKVVYTSKKLYYYRIRKGSETHQKFSDKKYSFVRYLQKKAESESDLTAKNLLRAWLCFSCVGFVCLAKKNKKVFKDEILTMKKLAKENKTYLFKAKYIAWYYKLVARLGFAFWCH